MKDKTELLATLWSFLAFTLMLIGIGGLSWSAFQDNGWVERWLGVIWAAETRNPLLMTPIIGGAIFLVSMFLRGGMATPGKGFSRSDVLVYLLVATGAYYAFVWVTA